MSLDDANKSVTGEFNQVVTTESLKREYFAADVASDSFKKELREMLEYGLLNKDSSGLFVETTKSTVGLEAELKDFCQDLQKTYPDLKAILPNKCDNGIKLFLFNEPGWYKRTFQTMYTRPSTGDI